ncbi:hypothetical protein CMV_015278 [Castanea mollissima]|uniref:THUMP domain-containing protein n=1 Tax=Castanea mollissima TaxID=60419 RepID=A0A8J4QUQ6_9ROSI|nr:hypothetical protein CMV_015278 [Castanea mollissima]
MIVTSYQRWRTQPHKYCAAHDDISCINKETHVKVHLKDITYLKYFPVETQNPQKFAVLYEARANSGIDRMKIINAVAKSIPGPHKVDLKNPDISIVVEIVKK